MSTVSPVTVSLEDLKNNNIAFPTLLQAFGPDSLGILIVSDLPSTFTTLRTQVLSNSSHLAALPRQKLDALTNEHAKYLVGWSHGKETLRPGVVDNLKGSYYINCAFYQDPARQSGDAARFPGFDEYTAANIWPDEEDIPGFKGSAAALITLIIDTAVLVARACDQFAQQEIPGYATGYLERMVRESTTTKARLLHYFPAAATETETKTMNSDEAEDSWCATHLDHGCLTGLTSAMFLDESSSTFSNMAELPSSPSPQSGLYIRDRNDKVHKVSIPRDCLAFQTGEALELITQGRFRAVPHFVKGVDAKECEHGQKIARNTLAVFTQPNLDEVVDGRTGLTFREFARGVVKKNTAG